MWVRVLEEVGDATGRRRVCVALDVQGLVCPA